MSPQLTILVVLGALIALWLFVRWRSAQPEFPPLPTSPDDPLMVEALAKARDSLPELRRLLHVPRERALIKLRFVSNSNEVEHLWAEVLEVLGEFELGVRLVTPPVTHSGRLDRMWRCSFDDIEDWQVRDANGGIHGGFSQSAMFAIARRDSIALPRKLLEQERGYR